MWFPRLVAWLAIIVGLFLLAVGAWSLLTGLMLAALQGLGGAFGMLLGGSLVLVLLRISEQMDDWRWQRGPDGNFPPPPREVPEHLRSRAEPGANWPR